MLYQNQNDETLVMLTLAGEQRAYEVLVVRYQNAVKASAASITKNSFMAEDAAQDAFVSAWMKLDTLKEPQKFASWVCRIAKNCAMNMVTRYKSFIPIETVENQNLSVIDSSDPKELYALSEERDELHQSIGKLPEKIRNIIYLHYFEGLSIAEIADRMRTSVGTVKWQLHDGRKKIRKELCAMNERYSDTLVQKVMKKVEELKLWQFKNDKSGFETVYENVLAEIDELPECRDKYHALADVLMRGWWWLPGEKNDTLFERIREAAELGENDEVMEFIVTREDSQVPYGKPRIEFIRDKQIPRLEKSGFVKTLAREWFWLGRYYLSEGEKEPSDKAFEKVKALLSPGELYYEFVPAVYEWEKLYKPFEKKSRRHFLVGAKALVYKYINGELLYCNHEEIGKGWITSVDQKVFDMFRNASICDGSFFAGLSLGETAKATDGTTLTFLSDSERVSTPCGDFENCHLYVTRYREKYGYGMSTYRTFYKEGVGIVRQEHKLDGVADCRVLKSYEIKGGSGYLPIAKGNTWKYTDTYDHAFLESSLKFTVEFANEEQAVITQLCFCERKGYDENSWLDMIGKIRAEYCTDGETAEEKICDVYGAIARAEELAKTPLEKAHAKAAASVARRILETNSAFNPNLTATGHWNFFSRNMTEKKNGSVSIAHDPRWSFEWKESSSLCSHIEDALLFNDIYGILQDATKCIWCDEWRVGASPVVEYVLWGTKNIKTQVVCTDAGTVVTKAGSFENCIKLELDISGMDGGHLYRGGKKEYYFADGIGIVRTVNEYWGGVKKAVYELTEYEGRGKGYMPICGGLMRRYDALDLTDGFVASAVYTYLENDEGETVIFTDRLGIRELPPPITQYGAIEGELIEERLWNEGKHEESRLAHNLNNFNLLCHFLGRNTRYRGVPESAVAWNKYRLKIIENLGQDGAVPSAWLGFYASTSFRTACALFGLGKKDEGYFWLDRAFEAFPKWDGIKNGTELDIGDPLIYGNIKIIKGKNCLLLPDGRKEAAVYASIFMGTAYLLHYGMTAPRGWEWFDPVRNEDRFREYVERAKKLAGK